MATLPTKTMTKAFLLEKLNKEILLLLLLLKSKDRDIYLYTQKCFLLFVFFVLIVGVLYNERS